MKRTLVQVHQNILTRMSLLDMQEIYWEWEQEKAGESLDCDGGLTLVEAEKDRRRGMARKILGCKHRSKKVLVSPNGSL